MRHFNHLLKPVSTFLVILMLATAAPYQAAYAKMISTGVSADTQRVETARDYMSTFMARDDVRNELVNMGISPDEATERVAALSDAEIVSLSDTIQESPAGAGAVGVVVGAALIVFLVLLVTDILGYTKVYPFTK
ncbi:MAG: PA2779 family protein [Deferribacterales bacterium]